MEYLKSGFKSVLGAPQPGTQPSEAEIVERLVERVNTSTLLDDRRDAVRALKALSKKFRLEVGAQAMDVLIGVLETDRNDIETVGYALETLCNITSHQAPDQGEEGVLIQESNDLAVQFTEIFIKKVENVSLLLSLLEEYDFHVRWPSVRLLTSLLINKLRDVQEIILVSPMGVSKLMDLLSESREVIRNDALLLLTYLTKSNANIQKIVAFENAFDRLLDIIAEEGNSDGGIVVEDCLMLLLNLLKNNTSNQNFFKEGSFIQRLTSFFTLQSDGGGVGAGGDENGWSAQKVTNIHLMLQVVRSLVSPNNPLQVTSSSQRVMNSCGLLEQLCNILMASGVPADILTETINTVSEVIRGNHGNQEYFASVTAPCNPPRPAIVVLLMSMVNEKQPFVLRCAVLYCFQCFLYKNELGQAQIIQTLLPTSADASVYTSGQLLCGGLFSPDPLSTWCAAVALSHALVDNAPQKEQLLRVQLATSIGNPPVSLLQQCTSILQHQGGKVQTRLGLLMLLCTWLSNCPIAVSHFVSIPTNVPFLMSQVALAEGDDQEFLVQGLCAFLLGICIQFNDDSVTSFNRDSLCQLVTKRIGVELFLDKLGQVTKHETYSQAAQKPQPKYNHPNDVLFDYEFCRLFKSLEGTVIKAVTPKPQGSLLNGPESNLSEAQHGLLSQYKSLIREQDQQLNELRQKHEDLEVDYKKAQTQVEEMSSSIQQLKDQNALLKAHRGTQVNNNSGSETGPVAVDATVAALRQEISELKTRLDQQQAEIQEKQSVIDNFATEHGIQSLSISNPESMPSVGSDAEVETLRSQLGQKDILIASLQEENQRLQQQSNSQSVPSDDEKRLLQEENACLQSELDGTRKEQEDLLVLLTEQDTKISTYKRRLRDLGDKIDDDDDDDDDENLDDSNLDDLDDEDDDYCENNVN